MAKNGNKQEVTEEGEWKNRIVRTGEDRAGNFLGNEKNWRIHPRSQQAGLSSVLDTVGFVQDVIVNLRTSPLWGADRNVETLLDGHLRVTLALRKGEDTLVPVKYVDLDPDEERIILTTFDPLGAMAVTDKDKLSELLAMTKKDSEKAHEHSDPAIEAAHADVSELIDKIKVKERVPDVTGGEAEPESLEDFSPNQEGIRDLKDEMTFKSNLPFGFPELLPDRILDVEQGMVIETWAGKDIDYSGKDPDYWLFQWGRESIWGLDLKRVLVGFYVEDFRFETFWSDPSGNVNKLLDAKVAGALMPNFSMYVDDPKVVRMFNHYRSLWVARYMQEAGIYVLPDVQSSFEDGDLNWIGVPKNVPIAVQSHTNFARLDAAVFKKKVAFMHDIVDALDPPVIVNYADDVSIKMWDELGDELNDKMIWVRARMSVRGDFIHDKSKSKKKEVI